MLSSDILHIYLSHVFMIIILNILLIHDGSTLSIRLTEVGIVLYIDILYLCAIWCIMLLIKCESWSIIHAFSAVYGLINFFTNTSAIYNDVACLNGTATEYLKQILWVHIHLVLWVHIRVSAFGCREWSHDIHWYLIERYPTYLKRTTGCRVLTRTSFFNL